MKSLDLYISKRLSATLPPLTDYERNQLETNIVADGEVLDPILWWNDGERKVVVDGMHRWEIIERLGITKFETKEAKAVGSTYEEAAKWVFDHYDGGRHASREAIGKWYNDIKATWGGRARFAGADDAPKVTNDTLEPTAEKIAKKAGISPRTVKRAGARIEALERCVPAIQKGVDSRVIKATDAQIKALSKATPEKQTAVAKAARLGTPLETAMAKQKIGTAKPPKPKPKPDYGKCPVCAGTKWEEDEDGVSCAKCHHPHGESTGGPDEDRVKTQRQKTTKTVEALMRAFDDLQLMHPQICKSCQLTEDDSTDLIRCCKRLLAIAKGWK